MADKPLYSNLDAQAAYTVKNLPLPVADGDAASKEYVDNSSGGSGSGKAIALTFILS